MHVISAEDIRLSGASSLPEVLRLAPGIDATRIAGNRWAVSIRGFASRLSNKLLVLVDGRNAFTPAFSGVIWEDFQFPMEDIERIEVLRGPAATIWGANGVNGVINIITKSAAATQGVQAVMGGDTNEGTYGRVRSGGQNADGNLFYRVYGSAQSANAQDAIGSGEGNGKDAYRHESTGFRIDGYRPDGARWDVSGDYYSVNSETVTTLNLPNTVIANPGKEKHQGLALRARYEKVLADGSSLQLQGAYSHSNLTFDALAADKRDTFDLELQHRFKLGERHEIVWGSAYRLSSDNMPRGLMAQMDETSQKTSTYGIFGQDEISLAETWRLTLGLRMDHNEFTGWEAQPDARLSWNIAQNHTVWGSLSKVSRAPSRGEHGLSSSSMEGQATLPFFPFPVLPTVIHTYNPGNVSERLKVGQVGLRSQWMPSLSTDTVLFQHKYDRLAGFGSPTGFGLTNAPAYIDVFVPVVNLGEMTVNGAELSADWRLATNLRLQLAQTWQSTSNVRASVGEVGGIIPHSITSIRASWSPMSQVDVDLWLRRTSQRPGSSEAPLSARNAFTGVDLRLAWRPSKTIELALIGQNLNDGACDAYAGLTSVETMPKMLPTCAPRSLAAQARLDF
ncbi:MAG: hypothetical protein ACD_23C00129G0003 [uncultured bacterium]|nr:MAG: hypothetical protein ACD_23C00129G0003 [uncultured bacterium]